MNEEQFLSSLKCLNTDSLEEFYLRSLTPQKRVGFQITLLRLITKNYSIFMVIYAFILTVLANFLSIFIPDLRKQVPEMLTKNLPAKSWYQSNDRNSSIVAVIKAAQARYNEDIFKFMKKEFSGTYTITLKDETLIRITPDEFKFIKENSGFLGDETKEKEMAYLAYAVIVKNSLNTGSFDSFEQAFRYFNSGSSPEQCAELLGFISLIMKVEPMRGINDIIVAYSSTYAVCITYGFIQGYGEKLMFAGHDTWGEKIKNAFLLC